jgi:hypothetical protein
MFFAASGSLFSMSTNAARARASGFDIPPDTPETCFDISGIQQ